MSGRKEPYWFHKNKYRYLFVIGAKQDWRCRYCGVLLDSPGLTWTPETATLDHKTPVSLGGEWGSQNLAVCCRRCNSRKGRKTERQYIKWLEEQSNG